MTRLQVAVSKSKLRRRLAAEYMRTENIPLKGFKRLVNGMFSEVLQSMPDPQIKRLLYDILRCYDVSAEERQEALKLLQMADTALTGEQRKAINRVKAEQWAERERKGDDLAILVASVKELRRMQISGY